MGAPRSSDYFEILDVLKCETRTFGFATGYPVQDQLSGFRDGLSILRSSFPYLDPTRFKLGPKIFYRTVPTLALSWQ